MGDNIIIEKIEFLYGRLFQIDLYNETKKEHYRVFSEKDELENLLKKAVWQEKVKEFAERVKMAFYYEFDELIPSIMADKIDEIAKEITEGEV